MNKFKVYPVNEGYAPHEKPMMAGRECSRPIYNSSAKAILTGSLGIGCL